MNATEVPLQNSSGDDDAVVGMLLLIEDITDHVRLEEQLQISEKMASIGLLAAGVAHEVNTPLTGISSFTQMLLEGADPKDPKTVLLEKIERQTFRAAKIVNGLLNLSRPGTASNERVDVDLNAIITDVFSLLEHQFTVGSIKVRRELSPSAAAVLGIEHQLQQVFLNLFLNARDAMPSGGWLSVSTRVEGDRVIAEIADTGSGIPWSRSAHLRSFFTTKSIGRGTGLGLSITYGIVREHDGTIDCDSAVGQGTRFTLALPLAQASARSARELTMATSRNGTIRRRRRGDHAGNPRDAADPGGLRRARRRVRAEGLEMARALPFDAAIVDIMMPGLDGIATLDELKRIDEDLNVIIITAYASVESAIAAMKTGAFDYVTKPFKNDEVVVVVRNAMERRRLLNENRNLRQNIQERYHKFANIIGRSPRMRQVFDLIIRRRRAARRS